MSISVCDETLAPNCRRNLLIAALTTGIPGLGLTAGGGAMLGIGLKRRKALKDPNQPIPGVTDKATAPAAEPAEPSATLGPMFLPDGGGATFTLRF
jgi:hypothetical protein